jgi:pimeloyl-ACP methyl ester carboxylesterase
MSTGPLRGAVVSPRGKLHRASVDQNGLLSLLLVGDLSGALRLPFPAAVRSALRGDPAPMLRLQRDVRRFMTTLELPPRLFSLATNVATTCEETSFPWARTAPVDDRDRQAEALVTALPDSVFAPFDRSTALDSDLLRLCKAWPASPSVPSLVSGPTPDVPVLLLEGEDDLRTPVESARRVAAMFPSAKLLVQQTTGHIASLSSEDETCALRALTKFLNARRVRARCPRDPFRLDEPTGVAPLTLGELRPVRGARARRGRALRALQLSVYDAAREIWRETIELSSLRFVVQRGGLRGGSLRYHSLRERLELKRYSFVPGVLVTGVVRRFDTPRKAKGRLRLHGPATPNGVLRVRDARVHGRVGGHPVHARLKLDLISGVVASAAQRSASSAIRRRLVVAATGAPG